MYYLIKETLCESSLKECLKGKYPYVAVLTQEEWEKTKDSFQFGIDMGMELVADVTKADVNYDSLTGNFSIPNRKDVCGENREFAFVLDENGIVFIDDTGYVLRQMGDIKTYRKWKFPSLERLIYDFFEQILKNDLALLQKYEDRLEKLENSVQNDDFSEVNTVLNDIRGELLDLRTHYEQLLDVADELEANENDFFKDENLRYFRMIGNKIERYREQVRALREFSIQIRDLYQSRLDVQQNKIMTVLTVITTVFFPLTLITGWYGMNFVHMPELQYAWAYPALAIVCVGIIIGGLILAKIKKWM